MKYIGRRATLTTVLLCRRVGEFLPAPPESRPGKRTVGPIQRRLIEMGQNTNATADSTGSTVQELTTATFDERVGDGLTVVDFWAPWCGPCRAMAPQFERAAQLRPQYRFAKVNVDEQPELAGRFEVRSIPTLAVIRDGTLIGTAAGMVRADDLVAALDRAA